MKTKSSFFLLENYNFIIHYRHTVIILPWSNTNRSERVRYRVEHEKIKFISIIEYVIFCLLYKHQWNTKSACFQRRDLLCNHNDGDLFTCEDNKLSPRVKIWSYHCHHHYSVCDIRSCDSTNLFKRKLKTHFLKIIFIWMNYFHLDPRSTFTFTRGFSYITSILIYTRKATLVYVRTHV